LNEQNLENSITLGNRILLALETPLAKSVLDLSTAGRQLGSVQIWKHEASKSGVLEVEKANQISFTSIRCLCAREQGRKVM
jgi:hypothetical protein